MNTIRPATSTQSLPSATSTAPVAVVQGISPTIGRLTVGQLLEATVISQTAKNTFQVQTSIGKFIIQSAFNMPKGSTLTLQLLSQSPIKRFQINSLNGTTTSLRMKTQGGFTAKTSQMGAQSAKLAVGNILVATLMKPLPNASSTVGKAPTEKLTPSATATIGLTKGEGLTLQKIDLFTKTSIKSAIDTVVKTPRKLKNLIGERNLYGPKGTSVSAIKAPRPLQVGGQISVKITAIQLPDLAAASTVPSILSNKNTAPTLSAGAELKGAVTGNTTSGHPIIQTRSGVFVLTTQTKIPPGTIVSLDIVKTSTGSVRENQVAPVQHDSLFKSRKWPALEQAFQALEEIQPGSVQKLIYSTIPRPGVSLTSSVIFFLSALKGGELHSWLGEKALRLIERTQPHVVSRIREDFTTLTRIAEEPAQGDWRVALIPINSGDEIQQIRLLLRQNEDENDEDADSDTRFVIDVKLSRFGRLQMDGLVRDKGKSLELILRSDTHLADTIQNDIRTIFREAADLSGLKGGVNFQAAPADFINIPDPSNAHDVVVVV